MTRYQRVARALHLFRGIYPVFLAGTLNPQKLSLVLFVTVAFFATHVGTLGINWTQNVDDRVDVGLRAGFQRKCIEPGDPVIIVTGWQQGPGTTNTMRVIFAPEIVLSTEVAPPYELA